ncbi:MAG: hypothetical protein ACO4AM_07230, partial [Candidatus Nanopelagicaceae bacterium]
MTAEPVDFERDSHLAAEGCEHDGLIDRVSDHAGHGRRPIDEHHHAVGLSILRRGVGPEDVLGVSVGVKAIHIEESSRAGLAAAMRQGGLAAFE